VTYSQKVTHICNIYVGLSHLCVRYGSHICDTYVSYMHIWYIYVSYMAHTMIIFQGNGKRYVSPFFYSFLQNGVKNVEPKYLHE